MGLFKTPPTPEEQKQQEAYEAAKVRLMELHNTAAVLFYIDEVSTDSNPCRQVLIGEVGKGQLTPDTELEIYSCEGLPVGTMTVEAVEDREEKLSFFEKGTRTYCTPDQAWDGFLPGQLLVRKKGTPPSEEVRPEPVGKSRN